MQNGRALMWYLMEGFQQMEAKQNFNIYIKSKNQGKIEQNMKNVSKI